MGSYVLGTVVSSVNDVISPVSVVAENCRREAAAEPTPRTAVMRLIVRNLIIARHLWLFRPLADLFTLLFAANPFSAARASLLRWSSDEFEDGLAHGGQCRSRRRPVDSFFPGLLF